MVSAQDKAPAKEVAKVSEADAAAIRMQKPTYPLDTCLVSGEKLGSMGEVLAEIRSDVKVLRAQSERR